MRRAKLTQSGIDPIRYAAALTPVTVEVKGLDGNASKHQQNPVRTAMMAILVLAGSTATLGGVAEDKKERVFQMLLIAATPFELIAGKMFGTVCVSLTNASIWLALSIGALYSFGLIRSAPIEMLPWFLVYLVCQITMLSATGAAIGARVGSPPGGAAVWRCAAVSDDVVSRPDRDLAALGGFGGNCGGDGGGLVVGVARVPGRIADAGDSTKTGRCGAVGALRFVVNLRLEG